MESETEKINDILGVRGILQPFDPFFLLLAIFSTPNKKKLTKESYRN